MSELSPNARALLDAARDADDPTPEQRASADAAARITLAMHGVTNLPPLGRSPGTGGAPPAGAASKVGSALGWKLGLSAAALLVAGLFGASALQRAPSAPSVPAAQPRLSTPAPTPAPATAPALATAPAKAAVPTDPPLARTVPLDSLSPAGSGLHSRALHPRAQAATARAAAAPTLKAEISLIASANALIRTQRFTEAGRVLASHARRFPRGTLREERDALTVLALCGTGPQEQARRAMRRFLSTAPQSVVAQRVRTACAGEHDESP